MWHFDRRCGKLSIIQTSSEVRSLTFELTLQLLHNGRCYLYVLLRDLLPWPLSYPLHWQRTTISSQGHTIKIALSLYVLSCKHLTQSKLGICSYENWNWNFLHSHSSWWPSKGSNESLCVYGEMDMSDLTSILHDAIPIVGRAIQQILYFEHHLVWLMNRCRLVLACCRYISFC